MFCDLPPRGQLRACLAALALLAAVTALCRGRGGRFERTCACTALAMSLFCCGGLAARGEIDRLEAPLLTLPREMGLAGPEGRIVRLTGRLEADPERADGRLRAPFLAETIEVRNGFRPFGARVLISWPEAADQDETAPSLLAGKRLTASVRLRRPAPFGNPAGFDYEGYMRRRGAVAFGSIKSHRLIEVHTDTPRATAAIKVRRRIDGILHRLYGSGGRDLSAEGSVLRASILGGRTALPSETERVLVASGVYHVLAVSGLQVAVLAGALLGLLHRIPIPPRIALVVAGGALALYGQLVAPAASVRRAVLMAALAIAARLLYRKVCPLALLAGVALALLVQRPSDLSDPGFQLTFAATAAILLFSRRLAASMPARWALDSLFAASLAAQAATWPLVALWFQRLVPFGLVSNLLAVPLGSAAVVLGMLLLPADLLGGWVVRAVGALAWLAVRGLLAVATLPVEGTLLSFRVSGGSLPLLPASASLLVLSIARRRLGLCAGGALMALAVCLSIAGPLHHEALRLPPAPGGVGGPPAEDPAAGPSIRGGGLAPRLVAVEGSDALPTAMRPTGPAVSDRPLGRPARIWPIPRRGPHAEVAIDLLDVGQGESLLVSLAGGETMLVDGGGLAGSSFDIGERVLVPELLRRGIRRIGHVFLTHADEDHGGGLREVLRTIVVEEFLSPDAPQKQLRDELEALARARGARCLRIRRGYTVRRGSVRIDCLAPLPGGKELTSNDASIVLRISAGDRSAILTGDISAATERSLLSLGLVPADLLKVAHHGSASSTTVSFLRAASPRVAVISTGAANRFGHPSPQVLDRLASARALILRTDREGAIRVALRGEEIYAGSLRPASPIPFPGPPLRPRSRPVRSWSSAARE